MSRHVCPICQDTRGWCWPHHQTGSPCCRRIGAPDQLAYDKHGAVYYYHGEVGSVKIDRPESLPLAAPQLRDKVYRTIWWWMAKTPLLSESHADQLANRGLTPELVHRAGLATWPEPDRRRAIVRHLTREHKASTLLGVPGIYRDPRTGKLRLDGAQGLAIPIYDLAGLLVAVRLRPDDPRQGKYLWLTSAGPTRGEGPSPGAPVYLAFRPGEHRPGQIRAASVLLVEGELAALRLCLSVPDPLVVSIPGVGYWRSALPILEAVGAERVRLAWDRDWRSNPHVARSLRECHERLTARGLEVSIIDW